jgi:transposase-like protein
MPKKKPPTGTDADLNLSTLSRLFVDEDAARAFLESKRWPNGPVCPHCQGKEAYSLKAKEGSKSPVRPGVYKCKACRKQFTVRIGTIFEESKLPLCKWLAAIHLMTSSKKGVSSHQISRELGITVKSAWFLTHRIREAMKREPMAGMLAGVVEADETYVGGKPRYKGVSKRGRGTKKTPVMVLVERDGSVRARPIENVDSKTLKNEIAVNVAKTAVIMTDELASYAGIGEQFEGGHETVTHGEQEYVRERSDGLKIHVNTAESFFSLLKRGHYGVFHRLSKKHLFRYCNEFGFRWDFRKVTDGERMVELVKAVEGKRLMYKPPKGEGLID